MFFQYFKEILPHFFPFFFPSTVPHSLVNVFSFNDLSIFVNHHKYIYRGRDTGYPVAPARIRTCAP
jgi:hypothetical protein